MTISRSLKNVKLLVYVFVSFMIGIYVTNLLLKARNASRECLSQCRFSQIRTMLLAYHEEYGAFPPTKYQPKPGGPIHSWRVLLLQPVTGSAFTDQYLKYDYSERWDSPANLKALTDMPWRYYSMDVHSDTIDYIAIGDGDDWPFEKPMKSFLITKGKDRFLLVEYPNSNIHWKEPKY